MKIMASDITFQLEDICGSVSPYRDFLPDLRQGGNEIFSPI